VITFRFVLASGGHFFGTYDAAKLRLGRIQSIMLAYDVVACEVWNIS
jgi:hypothetical protein